MMKESVLWPILQEAQTYATSDIGGGTNFDVDKFHNKFAELIVEKCVVVAKCNGHLAGFELGNLLKKYFEVSK